MGIFTWMFFGWHRERGEEGSYGRGLRDSSNEEMEREEFARPYQVGEVKDMGAGGQRQERPKKTLLEDVIVTSPNGPNEALTLTFGLYFRLLLFIDLVCLDSGVGIT
jgi:hypothetical protein